MREGQEQAPSPDDAAEADLARRQTRGSSLLLAGRVAAMLLTVTTQVVLVRALSKSDFGAFAFALSIASASRVLLSLGQGRSLSRHLAVYDEQRDYGRLFGSVAVTACTIVATSVVLVGVLLLTSGAVADTFLDTPSAADVLVLLVFLAPVEAVDEVFLSLFAVFARPRAIFFRRYLLTPGLRFVTVLVVAATSGTATQIAAGYVLTSVLGIALYAVLLRGVLRERGILQHLRPRGLVLPWREQFSFSLPLISNEFVFLSINTGSVLLLAYVATAEAVADYRAAFQAARLNQFAYAAFTTLYLPMAARYFARGALGRLRDEHWRTAMLLSVLSFPACAMTVAFAPVTTTTLLGDRYAGAAPIMAVLALGYYVNTCLGFNALALQVAGRIRYLLVVNVVVALANLALGLALVLPFGAVGVAASNAVALLLQNVLLQLALRRQLGTGFVDRRFLPGYAAVVVGLLLLAGAQVLLDPPILLALLLGAVVSIGVLVATRGLLRLDETFPELARVPVVRDLALPRRGGRS